MKIFLLDFRLRWRFIYFKEKDNDKKEVTNLYKKNNKNGSDNFTNK